MLITKPCFILCMFSLAVTAPVFAAGDVNAGKTKSAMCAGCHGAQGISVAPNYPNLAGQKEDYLFASIMKYRSGERNDPTMKAMVGALTEDDARNLAAHFSSLRGK